MSRRKNATRRSRRLLSVPRLPTQRKLLLTAITLLLLALLVYFDRQGWLLVPTQEDVEAYDGKTFLVARVIDGDTIDIAAYDALHRKAETRIRLWGIDCPEMQRFRNPAEPWAIEATEFTRDLCEGELVMLSLEPTRLRDSFDRLLAHVTVIDEEINISEALLEAGFAHADERWAHGLIERYRAAEAAARARNAGLWSDGLATAPGPTPAPAPAPGN